LYVPTMLLRKLVSGKSPSLRISTSSLPP